MREIKTSYSRYYVAACCLQLVGTVYFLIALFTPWLHDDLNFREMFLRANAGGAELTFDSWCNYLELIRAENDGRFSNTLEILFQFLPRGCFATVAALSAMVWVGGSAAYAVGRARSGTAAVVVTWLGFIIFLPWNDDILGCMNFELNYIVSSGVAVVLLLMLKWLLTADLKPGILSAVGCVAYAFIAGGFHEGFSLPLIGGTVLWLLLKRRRPNALTLGVLAAAVAGVCVDVFTDGLLTRIGGAASGPSLQLKHLLRYLTLPLMLTIGACVCACFPKGRGLLRRLWRVPSVSFIALAALCGTVMAVALGADGRICWGADMYAVILTVSCMAAAGVFRPKRLVTTGLWVLIVAFYSNVVYHQHRYFTEARHVMELYKQSADGEVDYYWEPAAPVITLHHVCRWNLYAPGPVKFITNLDSLQRPLRVRTSLP